MLGGRLRRITPFGPAAAVVAAFAITTIVMAGPYTNFGHLGSASYPGDMRCEAWIMAWDNYAVLHGLPLFDAPIYFPAAGALAYDEHLFGPSLFTLPVFAVTGNALLGINLLLLASWFTNGLAAYALAHRFVRDRLAAVFGGLVYAFSYYRMLHGHSHVDLAWAFLIPLSLIALDRWLDRQTWPRLLAWTAAMVLQILTSWYLAIFVLAANALFGLCLLAGLRLWPDESAAGARARVSVARAAVQLGVALILIAAAVVPLAAPYVSLPKVGMGESAMYSADATALFVPPLHTWMGQWLAQRGNHHLRWLWGETTLYLGAVATIMTAAGIVACLWPGVRRRRLGHVRVPLIAFALASGTIGIVLSLGPSAACVDGRCGWTPYDLFTRLPFMTSFRVPARFIELVLLAQVLLVAAGAAWMHGRFGAKGRAVTLALIPLMLSEWYVVAFPLGKAAPTPVPAVYRHLATLPSAPVVSLPTYFGETEWYLPADYELYQTVHWRPIVNGFGRAEPKEYRSNISHMSAFAGPNSAKRMRALGVGYVVLHTARYPDRAVSVLAEALGSSDFELIRQFDGDYLFRVRRPGETPAAQAAPPAAAAGSQGLPPAIRR